MEQKKTTLQNMKNKQNVRSFPSRCVSRCQMSYQCPSFRSSAQAPGLALVTGQRRWIRLWLGSLPSSDPSVTSQFD